jgi:predicted AAA+ superfamily ATPase
VGTYERFLDLGGDLKSRSVFLFGPRLTGKSFLLARQFPGSPVYDLLRSDLFFRLSARPGLLGEELAAQKGPSRPVVIDEIQKLPVLLDEVHHLIERRGLRFILTGSSPRKLVRGGANLLGGRARTRRLYPLVSAEIPGFDLVRLLNHGGIPSIYDSDEPREDLEAYCGTYLKEEIQAEATVRNIGAFARFLKVAGLCGGELLNFEAVANDAGVPARTVREYFAVLVDTLAGVMLEPLRATRKRKAIATSKFYFFDVGVGNSLAGRSNVRPGTEAFGRCLEHFVLTELRAFLDYTRDGRPLTFWRSRGGDEVDFVVGEEAAIEVKSTERVSERHLGGLRALADDLTLRVRIVVSMDPRERLLEGVRVLPVKRFLELLWGRELL